MALMTLLIHSLGVPVSLQTVPEVRSSAKAAAEERDQLNTTVTNLRKDIAGLMAEVTSLQKSASPEQQEVATALLELQSMKKTLLLKEDIIKTMDLKVSSYASCEPLQLQSA